MSVVLAQNDASVPERYRAIFDAHWKGDDAVTILRRAALEQFLVAGFPSQGNEDWKYTNLRRLEARQFALATTAGVTLATDQSQWIAASGPRFVFVNGHFMPSMSDTASQPPGTTLLTLSQWIENSPDEVAEFLSSQRDTAPAPFEQLNTAFFQDGIVIEVSADAVIDEPIYIVHQCTAAAHKHMNHPRLLVRAGANSRCTIIEHYVGAEDTEYFINGFARIDIDRGARLAHYRLQQDSRRSFHIGGIQAHVQQDAQYRCHDIALGAALGRVNLTAKLEGRGSDAILRGLFAPAGTQHLDAHTLIEHVAPGTTSYEEYRGIADGRGRGVFNGKVIVHPGAQKIDARQSSRNLLLSPGAEIDTKPELEIYAHDVKCSHGATTGQLDPASLFYLRSRGLSESDARALLIRAFAESILSTIDCLPVREHLEGRLNARFAPGAPIE